MSAIKFVLRDRLHVLRVGDDAVARIDVHGGDAARCEGSGDHRAGEALAVGGNDVGGARRHFANGGEAAQQLVKRVEVLVDETQSSARVCAGGIRSPAA